jgi:GntR family transcriptional repressor for pyruvate dehydrogenase complex
MKKLKIAGNLQSVTPQEIAAFLSLNIRNGNFPEGSRLPSEQALAEQFEVSRPVVREAISRIKADGLTISRRGSGSFVTSLANRLSFKIDSTVIKDPSAVIKLFELRLPIETSSAILASQRRTKKDLEKIEYFCNAMKICDETEIDINDLKFHLSIADATQNKYYTELMAHLGSVIYSSIRYARTNSDFRVHNKTLLEHEKIFFAIRDRNPIAAEATIRSHIKSALKRMQSSFK